MVREAQKMVRKEEKRKQREAMAAQRDMDDGDGMGSDYSSSAGPSVNSGSKKSKAMMDKQSAQSPHARSDADHQSVAASNKHSIGKVPKGEGFSQSE